MKKSARRGFKAKIELFFAVFLAIFCVDLSDPVWATDVQAYGSGDGVLTITVDGKTVEVHYQNEIGTGEESEEKHFYTPFGNVDVTVNNPSGPSSSQVEVGESEHTEFIDCKFSGLENADSALINNGQVDTIENSYFMDNKTTGAYPAAVLNGTTGTIDSVVNSVFSGNVSQNSNGGAIGNAGTMGDISESSFVGNRASNGAAILNYGTLNDISDSNFIGNYSQFAGSGTIYNGNTSEIGKIENNSFIGNFGSAISNEGIISEINNSVFAGTFMDYAINNTGEITNGIINSTFVGNVTSGVYYGGAIYTNNDLTITSDGGKTTFFGNRRYIEYDENGHYIDGTGESVGVQVDSSAATLTFNLENNGITDMYDAVRGRDGYGVEITGDGSGTMNLYNDLENANVNINNVDVNMVNNEAFDYNFKTLTTDESATYMIDLDAANNRTDRFNISESSLSLGTIYINGINAYGISDDNMGQNTYRVIYADDNNLELDLDDSLKSEHLLQTGQTTVKVNPTADVNWKDKVGEYDAIVSYSGFYALGETENPNDSIVLDVTNKDEEILEWRYGDTLKAWAEQEVAEGVERNFNFDSAEDVYELSTTEGISTSAGVMNINGVKDEDGNRSTIDAKNNALFSVNPGSTLNVDKTQIKNGLQYGGAAYNRGTLNITDSSFILNTAPQNGGAIYNNGGTISNISNTEFKSNVATSMTGGAIYNDDGTITNISGSTFDSNEARIAGGAICNFGTISEISDSTFKSNISKNLGGAIYNGDTISEIKNSTFTNNIAKNSGGAIYTNQDLLITSDNGTTKFQGNIQGAEFDEDGKYIEGTGTSNAIVMDKSTGKVTFDIKNNGVTELYDAVEGVDGYSVEVTGDGTGTMKLYNNLDNANVEISNVAVNTADGVASDYTFKNFTTDNTANYTIDLDFADVNNLKSDKFSAETSSGTMVLNDVQFNNVTSLDLGRIYSFDVLDVDDNNLVLDLGENLIGTNIDFGEYVYTRTYDATPNMSWDDIVGVKTITSQYGGHYNADGDKLLMIVTSEVSSEVMDKDDTLKAWAEQEVAEGVERNFNFDSAENVYELSTFEGIETSAGVMNINGVKDEDGNRSTINAKNGRLFIVYPDATLNIDKTQIEHGKRNSGGVAYNRGTLNVTDSSFTSNRTDSANGGVIYNYFGANLNIADSEFTSNFARQGGGAVYNFSTANISDSTFESNNAVYGGGAIENYNGTVSISSSTFKSNRADNGGAIENLYSVSNITDSIFESNTANYFGGAIDNYSGTLNISSSTFKSNRADDGGAIYNDEATSAMEIKNSTFTNNIAKNSGGAIYTNQDLLITSDNGTTKFQGNIQGAEFDEDGKYIEGTGTSNAIVMNKGTGKVTFDIKNNGVTELYDAVEGVDGYSVEIIGDGTGKMNLYNDLSGAAVKMDKVALNTINNQAHNYEFASLTLDSDINMTLDVDLANQSMDRLSAESYDLGDNKINVVGMNLLSDSNNTKTSVLFAEGELKDSVVNKVGTVGKDVENPYQTTAYSPLYKYNVQYKTSGNEGRFEFDKGGFNPEVYAQPATTLLHVAQMNNVVNNYAFHNVDTEMALKGLSERNPNKYALVDNVTTDVNTNNPLFVEPEKGGVWVKPYVTFENIGLKDGPKLDGVNYGTVIGYDSKPVNINNRLDGVFTGYVGYNGSNMHYSGNDIVSNGGLLGATYSLYNGDFFSATTFSLGASGDQITTSRGKDNTATISGALANKTGYNFKFKDGLFVLQPSVLIGYTFAKTLDYTSASGLNISSDPVHSMQISPGVKFYVNAKNGWRPYLGVNMMWNLMGNTHVSADKVAIPSMSIRPYVQYGIGIQKEMNDNFSAYVQAMIQNGGRNGVSLSSGMKYLFSNGVEPQKRHDLYKSL